MNSARRGRLAEAKSVLRGLLDRSLPQAAPSHGRGGLLKAKLKKPPPGDGRFLEAAYTGDAGTRPYKLYVPESYRGRVVPLMVMLHGCTQSADDFAAGTRMNRAADEQGFLVAYPEQIAAANASRCWNWFQADEQQRDRGEPSLIAGITRDIMSRYAVAADRVYVAGLSAGGAAAAIMGETYPDLFAAIGVHSGLPCGAASDLASALRAMHQGTAPSLRPRRGRVVPTIIFHGDQDRTVHPANAEAIIAQAGDGRWSIRSERARVPGGHAYERIAYLGADGRTMLERWIIEGAGHAWSGGSPEGSYTDPRGPDATREMLRFFREHPRV